MYYDITERKSNFEAHLRIDRQILEVQKGLFSFIIRVNNGNIVDVVQMENESYGSTAPEKQTGVPQNNRTEGSGS
jgi:uncharacterized protein YkvS